MPYPPAHWSTAASVFPLAFNNIMSSFLLPCSPPHSGTALPGQTDSALELSPGLCFLEDARAGIVEATVLPRVKSLHTITSNFRDVINNFPSNIQQCGFVWALHVNLETAKRLFLINAGPSKMPPVFITSARTALVWGLPIVL